MTPTRRVSALNLLQTAALVGGSWPVQVLHWEGWEDPCRWGLEAPKGTAFKDLQSRGSFYTPCPITLLFSSEASPGELLRLPESYVRPCWAPILP